MPCGRKKRAAELLRIMKINDVTYAINGAVFEVNNIKRMVLNLPEGQDD
jgi:hypothetical protein